MENHEKETNSNFIRDIIDDDLKTGKHKKIATRFPPEPNGYLHIGHAKSICLNFGIAIDYKGTCNLRFDDTNPALEDVEYVDAIQNDIKWLGFQWDNMHYASDYFQQLYQYAIELIKSNKAFVCQLTPDENKEYRGTIKSPGKNSPYRDRSVEENLELFEKMKNGEFEEGSAVLRAKIDMASPNLNMRDPVIYRIKKVHHHRTGDEWCIYPMYDFTHCLSDAIEHITHSLCSLEFEDHRPLYDWFVDNVSSVSKPRQIEFARLNLTHTVMSKRKLLRLVEENKVIGWDDPRLPTVSGMRRRGYTPEAIKDFCERIGLAKANSMVDFSLLQFCVREDLNKKATRVMAVLDPLKVVITNYPEGQTEELDAQNNPEDPEDKGRKIIFSRELYIEREDFMENPPKKYFRMSPGKEVRLKHAYYVTCNDVIKDDNGNIVEVHCTYDPTTKGGWSDDGRKVKGTSHWVSASHNFKAEVRLYDHLFNSEVPEETGDFMEDINPESLKLAEKCILEAGLKDAEPGTHFQFLRTGYFYTDPIDSKPGEPVFNRTCTLRDTWARIKRNMNK